MKELRILGILVCNRRNNAALVQDTLTKFGCTIKTRLGLHEISEDHCANHGLILLELTGNPADWDNLEKQLVKIDGVQVQKMDFAN